MKPPLKAPFPYFGGKSRVAHLVWERFGDIKNYVEPFAGSLAVLLARPTPPRIETINDIDCYISNFWRAVKFDPEEVAKWADWPVSELDLVARNRFLIDKRTDLRQKMAADPCYFSAMLAGWWVWGKACWIATGWAEKKWHPNQERVPNLDSGQGIIPILQRGEARDLMITLRDRLANARVLCGDWRRVLTYVPTTRHGLTGVFLDPPYCALNSGRSTTYATDSRSIAGDVAAWAIDNGGNDLMRIALCGYDGDYAMPDDWEMARWKANGGYANAGSSRGRENAKRERMWFSPHCQKVPKEQALFGGVE